MGYNYDDDVRKNVERCYKTALDILKPSKQELEHGLELHADAFVAEPYGFLPAAHVRIDLYDQWLDEGLHDMELRDRYEEYVHLNFIKDGTNYDDFKYVIERSGVNCIGVNAGIENNSVTELVKRLSHYTYLCDTYPEILQRCTTPEQMLEAKKNGKFAVAFDANAVPLPGHIENLEQALSFIRVFARLGVHMMHLTYNRRNLIGDGCAEPNDAGLSGFGRSVVAEMNARGVIPDLAHSGNRTAMEAAECSRKPVVISHAASAALSDHFRCKKDETVKAVAKSGGFVGVCAYPTFLRGTGDIASMLNHIEHFVGLVGADHVAIATDCGASIGPLRHTQKVYRKLPLFDSWWPKEIPLAPYEVTGEMWDSMAWTNFPLFTVGMVQRGIPDDDIRKILGGNYLRVLKETLV